VEPFAVTEARGVLRVIALHVRQSSEK